MHTLLFWKHYSYHPNSRYALLTDSSHDDDPRFFAEGTMFSNMSNSINRHIDRHPSYNVLRGKISRETLIKTYEKQFSETICRAISTPQRINRHIARTLAQASETDTMHAVTMHADIAVTQQMYHILQRMPTNESPGQILSIVGKTLVKCPLLNQ